MNLKFWRGGADLIEGQDRCLNPDDFIDPFALGGQADPLLAAQVLVAQADLDLLQFLSVLLVDHHQVDQVAQRCDTFLTPEFGGAVSADGTFTDAANFAGPAIALKGLQQILNLVAHLERMISLQIQVQLSSMKERFTRCNADNFMAATEARKDTVFDLFADAGLVNDGPREFDVTLGPEGAAQVARGPGDQEDLCQ